MRLPCAVVLLAVDLPAHAVLAAIDVLPLLLREMAAIGCAVRRNMPVDVLLAPLSACRFTGRHLSAADTLRNAGLLICTALTNLIAAIMRLRGIVLVLVDGTADVVLPAIDVLPLLLRELSAIVGAVCMNLPVKVGFARFKVLGLTRSQLT